MRQRAIRLRLELDRLDALADAYDGPGRERIVAALLHVRTALDEVERRIDAEAAGLRD
jgi:hypothetical protein